jgi:hypothetical protein
MKTLLIIILAASLCSAFDDPNTGPVLVYYGINIAAIAAVTCLIVLAVKSTTKKPDTTTQYQFIGERGLKQ